MTLAQFAARLRALGTDGLARIVIRSAERTRARVLADTKLNLSGKVLRAPTGRLRNSAQATIDTGAQSVQIVAQVGGGGVGGVPYAAIHEHGGTILPKRGRFLAIPMGPALKGGKNGGANMWPRDIPDLTFVSIRGGAQAMLVRRMGKGKRAGFVPWFHLVRSVNMPARPYLRPAVDAARPAFINEIREALEARLVGA